MPSCDYSRARANDSGVSALEVIVYKPRVTVVATTVALLAAVLLAAAGVACGGGDGGDERPVAFISDSIPGTLTVRISDETSEVISTNAAQDPRWSPNGARLAFIEGASDGGGVLKIWERDGDDSYPVPGGHSRVVRHFWAPDSNRIAFEAHDGGRASVYVFDTTEEEGVPSLITAENIGDLELGDWSGDNRWIAMRLVTSDGAGIFRRHVEGVDEVRLTFGDDFRPRFSPDGRNVAFSRLSADGSTDIHIVDAVRTGVQPTPAPLKMTSEIGSERDFEWSPNGRYITFVTNYDGDSEIFVLDLDGAAISRLTQNRVEDRHPRWSRADSSILFVSDADGDFDVFRMDLNSGDQRRIVISDSSELIADW